MRCTCTHAPRMNKYIQIRNVSPSLHKILMARAKEEGLSLSEYLRREMSALASRPTMKQIYERIRRRKPVKLKVSAAELIRQERDSR